jgi:hypothetical protein
MTAPTELAFAKRRAIAIYLATSLTACGGTAGGADGLGVSEAGGEFLVDANRTLDSSTTGDPDRDVQGDADARGGEREGGRDAGGTESSARDAGGVESGARESGVVDSSRLDDGSNEAAPPPGVVTVPLSGCIPIYTAPVTIGAGGPSFDLVLDTGSTTLAVASSACTDCTGVSPLYAPGSSAVNENTAVSSTYGGGATWSGGVYDDTVSLGTPATSASVRLAAIDSQKQFFTGSFHCGHSGTSYSTEGILGLARAPDAVTGTDGFFDQLLGSNPSMANVFAVELCDTGGTLWLGGYDPAALTGAPAYTPLPPSPADTVFYAVDLEELTVPGTSVVVPTTDYAQSIIDTGTSLFLLQPAAFSAITKAIASDTGFQSVLGSAASSFFGDATSCVNLSQTKAEIDAALPPLTLVFGTDPKISVTATATESYLVPYGQGAWCPTLQSNAPSSSIPLASVIGSPMLRSNVVIFDRTGMQVGFAPHAPCP